MLPLRTRKFLKKLAKKGGILLCLMICKNRYNCNYSGFTNYLDLDIECEETSEKILLNFSQGSPCIYIIYYFCSFVKWCYDSTYSLKRLLLLGWRSFLRAFASICLIRSRVTPNN